MTGRKSNQTVLLNVVAALTVASAGASILWIKTDGGRAFTSESARRLMIERAPKMPPPILLESSTGAHFTLGELGGGTVVVDFIYTNCPTVCASLGATFARLQAKLAKANRDDVRLLSIGFDTLHDTPDTLAAYGERHHADERRWILARAANPPELQRFLSSFGVVVIADGYGGFTHNAALHVIDSQGRLVRILDADDIEGVIASLPRRSGP